MSSDLNDIESCRDALKYMGFWEDGSPVCPVGQQSNDSKFGARGLEIDHSPITLTAQAGSTVTRKTPHGEPHTVANSDGAIRSRALNQGDAFTIQFDRPGTYKHIWSVHSKIKATIILQ